MKNTFYIIILFVSIIGLSGCQEKETYEHTNSYTFSISEGELEIKINTVFEDDGLSFSPWSDGVGKPVESIYQFYLNKEKIGEYKVKNPKEVSDTPRHIVTDEDNIIVSFDNGVNFNTNELIRNDFSIDLNLSKVLYNAETIVVDKDVYPNAYQVFHYYNLNHDTIIYTVDYHNEDKDKYFLLQINANESIKSYNLDSILNTFTEQSKNQEFIDLLKVNNYKISVLLSEKQPITNDEVVYNGNLLFDVSITPTANTDKIVFGVSVQIQNGNLTVSDIKKVEDF